MDNPVRAVSGPYGKPMSVAERLIPGDAEVAAELGELWLDWAQRCAEVGLDLARVDAQDWVGPAAAAFTTRLASLPGRWHAAADAFTTAGRAMTGFALLLADAQTRAEQAVALYAHAERLSAQARATLGAAATAVQDPGDPLRAQATTQLSIARAEAAADLARILTTAALAAPAPPGPPPTISVTRIGVCANGPDGTCVPNHSTVITEQWDDHGVVSYDGATVTVPAGTMIPTPGITDRQTDSEPGIPGLNQPPPSWQANQVDAAYDATHDTSLDIGLPFVLVTELIDGTYQDVTHPTVGSIAQAAAGLTPLGPYAKAGEIIRDLDKLDHEIKDVEKAEHAAKDAERTIDLAQAERDGGHAIKQHVGMSDQYLIDRKIPYASTFPDLATAEDATVENVAKNSERIQQWLRGSGSKLVIRSRTSSNAGKLYERDTRKFITPGGVETVLIRTPSGFRILTSYPIK